MENPNPVPSHGPTIGGAIALIVMGLVVFVPSGLCTGIFFFLPLTQPGNNAPFFLALGIGGPFVVGGAVMLWYGFEGMRAVLSKRDK
jgi:hypothetical protein